MLILWRQVLHAHFVSQIGFDDTLYPDLNQFSPPSFDRPFVLAKIGIDPISLH